MSRYTRWHHKRAANGLPSWLRDLGVKLLGEVVERAERAGLQHLSRVVNLPGGARIKASISGTIPLIEYQASAVEQSSESDEQDLFYVDSGWVRRHVAGWLDTASTSDIELEATAPASATYTAAMALLDGDPRTRGLAIGPEYGSHAAGDSLAIGREYETQAQDEADADLINDKLRALALVGRTTGLLRCLLKGRLGRRIGEAGITNVDAEAGTCTLEGLAVEFIVGQTGVIHTPRGFRFIKWTGATVECTPLRVHPLMVSMLDLFGEQPHGMVRQALATYLLAYASVDEDINVSTTTVTGAPTPYPNGWHFASSRPECIGTEMTLVPGTGYDIVIHKVEFDVTVDEEGVESITGTRTEEYSTTYSKTGAPVVWLPTPPPPYEMARLNHAPAAAILDPAAVYAFYDQDDAITPLWVQCTSDSVTQITTVLEDVTTNCCGACTATYRYSARTGITVTTSVSCSGFADGGGGNSLTADEIDGEDTQAGGSTSAGAASASAGTICFQSGALGSGVLNQLFHGARTWHTDAWSGTDGGGSQAAVIPYTFVDGAFAVKVRSRQMDSNGTTRIDSAGLWGGIDSGNGTEVHWTHVYGNAITGGGIPSTPSFPARAAKRQYRNYATAHGINASEDLEVVDASEFNDDPGDSTMPTTWLDQFISSAGPLSFVSLLAQSWHGEGWMRLGPNEFSVAFGGLDAPLNDGVASEHTLEPIGIQ